MIGSSKNYREFWRIGTLGGDFGKRIESVKDMAGVLLGKGFLEIKDIHLNRRNFMVVCL